MKGLIAAVNTPMHQDYRLNLDLVGPLYEHLKAIGCSGVLVNGTTGESMSLTPDERMQCVKSWIKVAQDPKFKVVVNVGSDSLALAKQFAKQAEQLGAVAFCCHAPSFFRPESVEQLVSFCVDVASTASELPFYFYHLPYFTNVKFKMMDFIKTAEVSIPNLTGIKFTDFDLMDFYQCLEYKNHKYNILLGRDEVYLPAKIMGCTGGIGSTYNYLAPVYNKINELYDSGKIEEAKKEFLFITNIISIILRYGGLASGKAIMKMIGFDCGPQRKPCVTLNEQQYKMLKIELSDASFFSKLNF